VELSWLHVPPDEPTTSIATLRKSPSDASNLLINLTEARTLSQTELNVKTLDDGQLIFGLVDCASTLDFVQESFVRQYTMILPNK
jgi:hypothetical protein